MPLKLVAIAGDRSFVLPFGRSVLVGRALACDLPVSDATVSRRHAELEGLDGAILVRDLGSTNGTFVNGERIREAVVPPGARLGFGKMDFTVVEEEIALAPLPDSGDDSQLDATILRQMPVRGAADLAARLAGAPSGPSLLLIDGDSTADRQARKLDLFLDIAKELSQQAEVGRLLEKVADVAFQVMSVDRVSILLAGPEGTLVPEIWRSRGEWRDREWHVPRAIARRAVAERAAFLIENVPADLLGEGTSFRQQVQSALCAPLLGGQGDVLGLIYLDNLGATHSFSGEDLEFLAAFASMVSVAIENSRLVERARREAVVLSNFQRYFAPDLAHQIAGQEGQIQLGGAKRRVAILFSDIRGFTSLSERMNPDEIARLLTRYFTAMVEIVFEHGGTLDKFIGDALMALWGAPVGHTGDADRAIRAAVAMQQRLPELNREMADEGFPALEVGIGLDLGDVFAGNIGSERRLEYTVIGDAVNTASRLCAEASPGEVLISECLYRGLTVAPPVDVLMPLQLKGKASPVPVYRVDWRAERPTFLPGSPGDATATRMLAKRPAEETEEGLTPP